MSENDGGHAFPASVHNFNNGLSKRDYFAAAALTGLLSADATYGGKTDTRAALARDAYAMLAAATESRGR